MPDKKQGSLSPRVLPTTTISMSQVADELREAKEGINLNSTSVRTLANKHGSSPISMSDLRGKSTYANVIFECGRFDIQRGLFIGSTSFGRLISKRLCTVRGITGLPGQYKKLHVVFTAFNLPTNKSYRAVITDTIGGKIVTDYQGISLQNTIIFNSDDDVYNMLVQDWIEVRFEAQP